MSKEELEIVKNMIEYFQGKIDSGYHKIFYNDLDSDFKTVDGINVLNKVLEQQKEINEAIEYIENAKKELYGCGNYYLSDLLNILKGE